MFRKSIKLLIIPEMLSHQAYAMQMTPFSQLDSLFAVGQRRNRAPSGLHVVYITHTDTTDYCITLTIFLALLESLQEFNRLGTTADRLIRTVPASSTMASRSADGTPSEIQLLICSTCL